MVLLTCIQRLALLTDRELVGYKYSRESVIQTSVTYPNKSAIRTPKIQ